ncbi:MAG: phosphoribosylanthranilate isomerase [Capsulimonadaceae bacterium]|nr:phosphoribosylanthranilate isomerase [Capsulimonadaceae bacterium]
MKARVHVKICGLTNLADALSALDAGADRLGFIGVENTPRFITPQKFAEISAALPPETETVVVVRDVCDGLEYGARRIQYYAGQIEAIAPEIELIPVIRPRNANEAREMTSVAPPRAVALLVDAYHPAALGGTGETGDWRAAAEAVRWARVPVYLAGGLSPDNVADAIAAVRPYGVDVSSGVEARPGAKDPERIRAFIEAVRGVS